MLAAIALLVALNIKYKFRDIFSLLIAWIFVVVTIGTPLEKVVSTVQQGIGNTMGNLVLIIISGAFIGKFMTEPGASKQIADMVIRH